MNQKTSGSTALNDKQRVLHLLQQANHTPSVTIGRRSFCSIIGLASISLLLPSCKFSESRLHELSRQQEFNYFLDVIFPAVELGIENYQENALLLIQQLPSKQAIMVMHTYLQFKKRLASKNKKNTLAYNKAMGEAFLIEIMQSKHAIECNLTLDIIYNEFSRDKALMTAIWGREVSITDRKCAYWETYDQAIS